MRALLNLQFIDAIARAGSIRQAAEALSITPSALNRRLIATEEELGVQIFERLARGVRLNAAGEVLIHHIRSQLSDFERVKSQIADLSGARRGHVSIACSQALLPTFLPEQIELYRQAHPAVSFRVLLRDRAAAEEAISDFSADLALVFEPIRTTDFHTLATVPQAVCAVMDRSHPLAEKKTLRLRDCLAYPMALPSLPYGVRQLLVHAAASLDRKISAAVESDSFEFLRMATVGTDLITFQIEIGLPSEGRQNPLVSRPIDARDIGFGALHLGHLRGRVLPIAVGRFADQVAKTLSTRYGTG